MRGGRREPRRTHAMELFRYRAWDGSQTVEAFSARDAMDHIAEQILDGSDMRNIMRGLLSQGMELGNGSRIPGLRELLERTRARRAEELQRYDLTSVFDEIANELEGVVERERATVEQRLRDAEAPREPGDGSTDADEEGRLHALLRTLAQQRREQLDALPEEPGGRISALRDYDFLDPGAREEFEALLGKLQQQLLQHYFQQMQQSLEAMTPEGLRQTTDMVRELNELLRQRLEGGPSQSAGNFQQFMERYGGAFPDGIETLDDLLDTMQAQVAGMQSLMRSLTSDQREQLQTMMRALLQDHRLQVDLMETAQLMQQLRPFAGGSDFPFAGEEPVTLQQALRLMGELNDLEALERRLQFASRTHDVESLELQEIERLLGEEARWMAERMQEFARVMEDAGLIRRKGNEWTLTPRAMRKIGERALRDIFDDIEVSASGEHSLNRNGAGLEVSDETKRLVWGDSFGLVDTNRTVLNAVLRDASTPPVRVTADDFEVRPTLALTQASTVIMLDMSYSMMQGGRFQAGRRIALALDTLIRSKYPKDNLYVVAFSYFVLTLKPSMLLDSYWVQYGGGTNFQQAFKQARQLLSKHHSGTKQIVFITDGEPTTSTYGYWDEDEERDPVTGLRRIPNVLEETLREVTRCTRDDITINTFILDSHPSSGEFMRTMARINRGRAFFGSAHDAGEYVLADYVRGKRVRRR